jgi:hypothetical protein
MQIEVGDNVAGLIALALTFAFLIVVYVKRK